ncbi:hypothetical protein ACHAQA_005226 [Verticillium albo-atrum]
MAPSASKGVFVLFALIATIGNTVAASDAGNTIPDAGDLLTVPSSSSPSSPSISTSPIATYPRRKSPWRLIKPTTASASETGYSKLGCLQDESESILGVASLRDPHMTPQLCRDHCSARSRPVFGIRAAVECHCQVDVELLVALTEREEKEEEEKCSLPCPGDEGPLCGGVSAGMVVYAATDVEAPIVGRDEGGSSAATPSGEAIDEDSSDETDSDPQPDSKDIEIKIEVDHDEDHEPSSAPGGANLGRGMTIGIAVGAVALSGVITGIVMLLFCRRRRGREQRAMSVAPSRGESIYARAGPLPPPPPPASWGASTGSPKTTEVRAMTVSYAIPEGRRPDREGYEMSERR